MKSKKKKETTKVDLGSRSKVKIISSGNPFDVKVIDQKTGEVIGLIQKIVWSCDVQDQIPKCTIELACVPIDVEVDADIVKTKPTAVKKSAKATKVIFTRVNTEFKE